MSGHLLTYHRPEYWLYMSQVMERRLKAVINSQKVISEKIPAGVFSQSNYFFELARTGADYNTAHDKNRKAHLTLFTYLCRHPDFKTVQKEKIESVISNCIDELAELNKSFAKSHNLSDGDLKNVKLLLGVYQMLIREGWEGRRKSRGHGCF